MLSAKSSAAAAAARRRSLATVRPACRDLELGMHPATPPRWRLINPRQETPRGPTIPVRMRRLALRACAAARRGRDEADGEAAWRRLTVRRGDPLRRQQRARQRLPLSCPFSLLFLLPAFLPHLLAALPPPASCRPSRIPVHLLPSLPPSLSPAVVAN
eukprot:365640-Chlamydomonas_euryale.AAC.5